MKLEERVLEVDSTLSGERVGMAVGEDALAHIMAVLTDLYSDPEMAVIREYSTNALDSHIDAGTVRPIEVTTPTPMSAFLKIRDYGLGLDAEGIRKVYSQYGVSTKRESDEVVGMLGLGCKSALTYTDQFMLTGIKDGVQTQVSIGRDEDGGGSMTIVSTTPTDEPNGVLVVIPAKKDNKLAQKAHRFFRWWEHGTVLLNGELPAPLRDKLTRISENVYTHTEVEEETNLVIMGNVAYPIPDSYFPAQDGRKSSSYGGRQDKVDWFGTHVSYSRRAEYLVAFVPIGAVNFAPSREALRETKRTKETLTEIITTARATLKDSLFAQVAAAKTATDAQELTRKIKSLGIKENPLWKGREVLLHLEREGSVTAYRDLDDTSLYLVAPRYQGRGRLAGERTRSVSLSNKFIVLDNFDGKDMTPTKRGKLELYLSTHTPKDNEWTSYIAVGELTPDERFWLTGRTIIDFATEIEPLKLTQKAVDGTTRPRGSYDGIVKGSRDSKIQADTIDTSKPIVYLQGNHYALAQSPEARSGFLGTTDRYSVTYDENLTIICLPGNRVEKFKRDFPTAIELSAYAVAEVGKYLATLDKEDLKAAHFQRGGRADELKKLDPSKVDDPTLKAAITLAQRPVADILKRFDAQARWIPRQGDPYDSGSLKGYPLLGELGSKATPKQDKLFFDHAYMYINAVYAAKEDA